MLHFPRIRCSRSKSHVPSIETTNINAYVITRVQRDPHIFFYFHLLFLLFAVSSRGDSCERYECEDNERIQRIKESPIMSTVKSSGKESEKKNVRDGEKKKGRREGIRCDVQKERISRRIRGWQNSGAVKLNARRLFWGATEKNLYISVYIFTWCVYLRPALSRIIRAGPMEPCKGLKQFYPSSRRYPRLQHPFTNYKISYNSMWTILNELWQYLGKKNLPKHLNSRQQWHFIEKINDNS